VKSQPTQQERTFPKDQLLVSKTDLKGKITYANQAFIEIAGYSEAELIGQPHNIVRHPDMPKIIFKMLWEYLQRGSEIHAYVINCGKDGSYYWVLANVTPSYGVDGKIVGYHSARRNPDRTLLEKVVKPLYRELLELEKSGGIAKSEARLNALLQEKGVEYEEFILSI